METGREEAHELLDAFADRGGNFIDTANGYGEGRSEKWIGEWLADQDREDFVIASKCYWSDVSRFQENLSKERPRRGRGAPSKSWTPTTSTFSTCTASTTRLPSRRTLRTVDDLISEGKVNYVGISTCDAWKLTKGLWQTDVNNYEAFTVTQPQYSATHRDPVANYLDVCADQDLAVCPVLTAPRRLPSPEVRARR